jgi:hypothetical protein
MYSCIKKTYVWWWPRNGPKHVAKTKNNILLNSCVRLYSYRIPIYTTHVVYTCKCLQLLDSKVMLIFSGTYRGLDAMHQQKYTDRYSQHWGHRSPPQFPHATLKTTGAQCSMLLWCCYPPPPLSLTRPASQRVAGSTTAAKNSFAGWKSPKGFSVPSSLGVGKSWTRVLRENSTETLACLLLVFPLGFFTVRVCVQQLLEWWV